MPEPPLALAAVTATCTAVTRRKKRCKNKVKKGSANGLCALHQPDKPAAAPAAEPITADPAPESGTQHCPAEPICETLGCANPAAENEHCPDSAGGTHWSLCDECYEQDQEEPTFGEAVEANNFFAEVATAIPTATDDPTKLWNGFGTLPNCMMTDDHCLFKLAWEAKGCKVTKAP